MLNWLRKTVSPQNPLRRFWYLLKSVTAAFLYGLPGRRLRVIGITGTNGKTTTTHLIEHLLRHAGEKVAMISTVQFSLNGHVTPNETKLTSVSPFVTQKFLKKCAQQKIRYLALEASSHALDQHRLWGIPFQVGVLTNITHEHLDYHHTMEEYKEAKKKLFKGVETAVLNTADVYFADFQKLPCKKISYGLTAGDLQPKNISYTKNGSEFTCDYRGTTEKATLQIPGDFNVENALAAVGAMLAATDLKLSQIVQNLSTFQGVGGRMERIKSPQGFEVIVDFGLTPDALNKIYKTIRASAPARVIGIIGSCGDRDKTKRPMLGQIVAGHCDLTIVTDEEPYTENPRAIMDAVLKGALSVPGKRKGIELELIEDRYEAIEYAVAHAQPGDSIVVTGMGNFQTRAMNHGKIPWDERQVVREIIAKYN